MGAPGLSCYTPLVASCSTGGLVGSAFCVPDPLNVSVTTSRSLSLCLCRSLTLSFFLCDAPLLSFYPTDFDTFLLPLWGLTHALKGAVCLELPANETFDVSYIIYLKILKKTTTFYAYIAIFVSTSN